MAGAGQSSDDVRCESADDMFRAESRYAMVRYCAELFDRFHLTPTEFLYSGFYQRKLYESGALLASFQTAAQAQARAQGGDPRQRQQILVRYADEIADRTRSRDSGASGKTGKPQAVVEAIADIVANQAGEAQAAALMDAMAPYLDHSDSWMIKIFKLDRLCMAGLDRAALGLLDQILSEILINRDAMSELLDMNLGIEGNLPILIQMHDADANDVPAEDLQGGDIVTRERTVARLCRLIAGGDFPQARTAIANVIGRIIASPRRFRAQEGGIELDVVIASFAQFDHVSEDLRHSAVADGYRVRVEWSLSEANLERLRIATPGPAPLLDKILFFYRFAQSDYKRGLLDYELERIFRNTALYNELLDATLKPIDQLRHFVALHEKIRTVPIESLRKLKALDTVAELQTRFIKESRILSNLAKGMTDVVRRAEVLMAMTSSGAFLAKETQDAARRLIRFTVADPQFRDLYLKDTSSADEATKKLEKLRQSLGSAGLM